MITLRVVGVLLGLATATCVAVPAQADTETCVSLNEFGNTYLGESVVHVATRFDVYGRYVGDTDDGTRFRRSYRSCWAPGEERAIVVFSYNSNGAVNWYVRD